MADTITKTTVPYEVTIRFDADGAYQGAHYVERTIVRDGDAVLSDIVGHAQPIKAGKFDPKDIRKILDVAMAERIDALEVGAKDAAAAVERLTADLADLRKERESLYRLLDHKDTVLAPLPGATDRGNG